MPRRSAPSCPFCAVEGSESTCANCVDHVALDGLIAVATYGDPMAREAIHEWKYTTDPDAFRPISQWIRRALPRLGSFSSFAVSWIPLHAGRKRGRGFDQAEMIAQEVAQGLGAIPRLLLSRIKKTEPRAKVAHGERLLGDMDDVFASVPNPPSAVLLCDDVFTSGATMDAAAKALKDAGCACVWGFVLARGTQKK